MTRGCKICGNWLGIRSLAALCFSFLFMLIATNAYSVGSDIGLTIISRSVLHLILCILGIVITISLVIAYFTVKLKKVNEQLQEKNNQILSINSGLKSSNLELENQKRIIAEEHYESERFYDMLLRSADDGISFYDKDLKLKYNNAAFYSIIGFNKDSYNNAGPDTLFHPEDSDYMVKREESLLKDGFFEAELRLKHKNGNYIILSTRSVAVRDDKGEIIGSLTISRDITRMKKVHEELIKAKVEAEASSRLKSSFLANISHEIRTPLNSVVGFSNLLLSDDITRDVRNEYIEQINHNSEKLLQIIGDIIDLSRLESSQIEITYEESSLGNIINEIIEETRQIIRRTEKSITLRVLNRFENNGDLIFTDKIWLKRILSHLMDNAVKFTLDGSIEFSYCLENENILFRIKDTGIGINKENLVRIFEEFNQEIGGHHRPFEGLGIGLTLAREVVERMGGRIYVKSEKGIGSEFSFSIPYRPAGSTKIKLKSIISEKHATSINWQSRKCLIVDDNKDVLIYLNRILVDTGVLILTARSGYEALEIIRNTPDIDVVLIDMQMPEMNGIEATKEIRKIRGNLPIIAQTAFIFEDDKDIILEAGCDACLIKPIRKDHLITTMASFMKAE
jgi:PAS domain S-box-containing protein